MITLILGSTRIKLKCLFYIIVKGTVFAFKTI